MEATHMTISELKQLQESGEFHHATYRDFGTLWEGLWIYVKYDGLRGFQPAGCFGKDHPELKIAESMCRGISVGSYGQG
jgi:hypothetical protein